MANRHFASIGDVWKHLPLAEIMSLEGPVRYWESHAGSASYHLTHSPERDYGVFRFMEHTPKPPSLSDSVYLRMLQAQAGHEELATYPGSPLIAMTLLRDRASFILCDTDGESVRTIRECAYELGLTTDRAQARHADGVLTLAEVASHLSEEEARLTLAFIDPYQHFKTSANDTSPIQLFTSLCGQGIMAILWYGYDAFWYRDAILGEVKRLADPSSGLWCGDIHLVAIDDLTFNYNPGVLGCGVACGNLNDESKAACDRLGHALEEIYADSVFPSGHSGAIRYATLDV